LTPVSWQQYHLLWSPHVWKKVLGTVAVVAVLPPAWHLPNIVKRVPIPAFMMGNIVLPLAASSCCVLQLALNLLSVGCAGWNSYLGPVRPYFLGILLYTTVRYTTPTKSPVTLLWRSVVALLPEIVFTYNTWRQRRTTALVDTLHPDQQQQHQQQYEVQVDIPSMGCVACINSIDRNLAKVPGVLHVQSQLHAERKGGSATLLVATNADCDDPHSLTEQIIATLARSGFDHAVLTGMKAKEVS
jgi:copper chaperone CopZ